MSTSGSFTPAGTPPCPAPMTRAALLALRAAGQLRTECHYIVTDGPTIGTTGNTSVTTIELHAVSATELALEARVHTTFDNTAWDGSYDIDAGTAGTIFRLLDSNNNFAEDEDTDAPTVHTQVPWHRGGTDFSGNRFDTAVLTGWDAAGGTLNDNTIKGSSVVLTGMASGFFRRNVVENGSAVTISTPTVSCAQNTLTSAFVLANGTNTFGFQNNTMLTGTVQVDAATTSQVALNNNVFGGTVNGYRISVAGATGANVIVSGNRLFDQNAGTQELLIDGSKPLVTITGSTITAGDIRLQGVGTGSNTITGAVLGAAIITQDPAATNPLNINGSEIRGATVQQTANALGTAQLQISGGSRIYDGFVVTQDSAGGITVGGSALHSHGGLADDILQQGGAAVLVNDSDLTAGVSGAASNTILNQAATGSVSIASCRVLQSLGAVVTRLAGATGSFTAIGCTLNAARFVHGATNTGITLIQNVDINTSLLTHNGAGSLTMGSGAQMAGSGVTLAASSTRGVSINSGVYDSATITQNRTGGSALDQFQSSYVGGQASVILNGAVDPGAAQTMLNRARVEASSVVTITDPASTIVLQNSELVNATMTFPAGCLLNTGMRFHRCSINVGAFTHDGTIVDGPYATAFTASNNNRLANAGFSNCI